MINSVHKASKDGRGIRQGKKSLPMLLSEDVWYIHT